MCYCNIFIDTIMRLISPGMFDLACSRYCWFSQWTQMTIGHQITPVVL